MATMLLFAVFCGRSTASLTGPAYVLQRLQRFRVDGHVSWADSVWTEDFFDIDFGSFLFLSPFRLRVDGALIYMAWIQAHI